MLLPIAKTKEYLHNIKWVFEFICNPFGFDEESKILVDLQSLPNTFKF